MIHSLHNTYKIMSYFLIYMKYLNRGCNIQTVHRLHFSIARGNRKLKLQLK